ncbi:hypothetical protein PMAYCL1PPCAC_33010, partial [Pristionchus mayeri]
DSSYALYLIHWPIVCVINHYGSSIMSKTIGMVLCAILSIVCYEIYEKWYTKLSTASAVTLVFYLYSICAFGI